MRQFVESLRRLFVGGMLTDEKIIDLLSSGRISEDEMSYIKRPV